MTWRQTGGQSFTAPLPFLVLGAGNILMADEGVGVRVLEALKQKHLPDYAELIDAGTALVELLPLLRAREKVVIIDAVKWGGKPGTVYRFTPDDVTEPKHPQLSLHQVGILEALSMAELAGWKPSHVVIFGIEPEKVEWGMELSAEVAACVPEVVCLVAEEITRVAPHV
jgi:hydrogenase maturation protease